jgi:hypothetical protein
MLVVLTSFSVGGIGRNCLISDLTLHCRSLGGFVHSIGLLWVGGSPICSCRESCVELHLLVSFN